MQIFAFIALFLFASGFFLSFPAYLFLIITEIAIIYCIITKRKDIFLYLWQMQFFITIAFCIIERSDIFFNSRDVPYEIVWISLGLILVIEVMITLLFLYRERVIKKFLTGITLTTICIVILLMATICYEGVQIFSDVEPSSYLLSSDWRPSPSVPEHDNVVMTINSNVGFYVETIDDINILANETQLINITVINSKNIEDDIHLVYAASYGLIITTDTNNSSVRLGPYAHANQSLEVRTSFICNHRLTIVAESDYYGRTV